MHAAPEQQGLLEMLLWNHAQLGEVGPAQPQNAIAFGSPWACELWPWASQQRMLQRVLS